MPHPLAAALELVEKYAPLCSDRDLAVAALTRLSIFTGGDERACRECGDTFYLCEPERAFFAREGLREPVRCKACRVARKQARGY